MTAPRPVRRYSVPLTPAECAAILSAVTDGGRSQRAVAADPTFRASHDQVRAVVRQALCDHPTLIARFPLLSRRAAAEVRELVVVDPDDTAGATTVAEALAAAGVNAANLRVRKVITRMRIQVHLLRSPDGSITSVSSQQPEIRVEWVPVDDAPVVRRAMPIPVDHPAHTGGPTPPDGRWRLRPAAAVGLVLLLLVIGAALTRLTEAPVAPGEAPGIATTGQGRSSPR